MSSSVQQNNVDNLIEVTGVTTAQAEQLLAACSNNLEEAIALHFEGGGGSDTVPDLQDTPTEEFVRPPIAPRRELLCRPEDDNFLLIPPTTTTTRRTNIRNQVKVCPLRDFAREGALMEQQLQESDSSSEPFDAAASANGPSDNGIDPADSRKRRRDKNGSVARPGTSRLGDLYRPPTDITIAGTFQTARSAATELQVWLLVNIQSDNFQSHILNRDVWSDKHIRDIIKKNFLLWQVDDQSYDGRRFCAFYHCRELPYICIVDPRTGEEVWKCVESMEKKLLKHLKKFLAENKTLAEQIADESPSTSKRSRNSTDTEDIKFESDSKKKKGSNVTELTEEEQMALAIRNSMNVHCTVTEEELERLFAADSFVYKNAYEKNLGKLTNELTRIKLRLWNKEGNDETIQLNWPSDTRLQVLRWYIEQKHKHIPPADYRVICAFPRTTFQDEHFEKTLKELGLHPTVNLHITVDD